MTRYLACCSLGILGVGMLPALPDPAWSPAIMACALLLASLLLSRPGLLIGCLGCTGLGLCWSVLVCQDLLEARVPDHWVGTSIWIEGEITDLPQVGAGMLRFVVQLRRAQPCAVQNGTWTRFDCKNRLRIRLSYFRDGQKLPELRPGEIWRFQVKLKPPHGLINAPVFDYEAWLLRHGIAATGYVQVASDPARIEAQGARRLFQQARYALRAFVTGSLRYSPHKDLLLALAIGDNQAISHDHWDTLSRTGTNHLLIISGLHVSLVIGMAYGVFSKLFGWLVPGPHARRCAILTASITAVGYAGIAGFGLPVQRSLIMALVVFGSRLFSRAVKTRHVFLWALLAVTAMDPLASYSVGFWLSFSAVMVLLLMFSGRFRVTQQPLALLTDAAFAQWGVYVSLFTMTAYLLLQVSVISPLANMVAIPVISLLVVPVVMLAIAWWLVIGEPASYLLHLADQVVGHLWSYLELLAHWNLVWIPAGVWIAGALFGWMAGLLLVMPVRFPGRWLSACLILPSLLPPLEVPDPGEFRVRVLDVGQGLSVLIQTRRHSLVYDLGAKQGERFDMGELVVVPVLRSMGISRLDKLIVSNADNDHAGGAATVLNRLSVLDVISGDPANVIAATGIGRHVHNCRQGTGWSWDGVEFAFLHPDASGRWQGNDKSCVLMVSTGSRRALIPGDISSLVELYLKKIIHQPVDLLVVPHHGSNSSSSPGFLNQLQPAYAIISAGFLNRYDHPSPAVVRRYLNRSTVLFSTWADGAVEVTINSSGVKAISGDRQTGRKFWFHDLSLSQSDPAFQSPWRVISPGLIPQHALIIR